MSNIDPVALIALVISLVALAATVLQLLQQYFATADGYRRCQPGVMGKWGTKTTTRIVWRELRYETIYYVPNFSVDIFPQPPAESAHIWKKKWSNMALTSSYVIYKEQELCDKMKENDRFEQQMKSGSGEPVCWVTFMDQLRVAEGEISSVYTYSSSIKVDGDHRVRPICALPTATYIQIQRRSWDFMPPDAVRPFCVSTISDIANLALRLDMVWKIFDPANGDLRAEGPGRLLTSRFVTSIGICLEYSSTDHDEKPTRQKGDIWLKSYLPVSGISDLIFGIVPGNTKLNCWTRPVGKMEEINEFLDFLDNTGDENMHLVETLEAAMNARVGCMPGFSDIIPLTAPMMASKSSFLCNLPMPNKYSPGLLRTKEGLQAFCERLRKYIASQDAASQHHQQMQKWIHRLESNERWNRKDTAWACMPVTKGEPSQEVRNEQRKYQVEIHDVFDQAEEFLCTINKTEQQGNAAIYDTLLVEHIRMAIPAYGKAMKKLGHKSMDKIDPRDRDWLAASMEVYWDELPVVAKRVAVASRCDVGLAADAWVIMIFRAFCWHHCHRLIPTKMVLPSEWHRSKMPVYMG